MPEVHKCPACDGWGQRETVGPVDTVCSRPEPCPACSGKGVLWEPEKRRRKTINDYDEETQAAMLDSLERTGMISRRWPTQETGGEP